MPKGVLHRVHPHATMSNIYVMGGRFDRMGPLGCLSPFPVQCWIRSDKCSYLRFLTPMSMFNLFPIYSQSGSQVPLHEPVVTQLPKNFVLVPKRTKTAIFSLSTTSRQQLTILTILSCWVVGDILLFHNSKLFSSKKMFWTLIPGL